MMKEIILFLLSPLAKYLTASIVIGGIGITLYLITPRWFPDRFRKTALFVGVGALVVGGFYWRAFHAGEAHMAQRIAARDAAAIARIDAGRKEVLSCNGGADWDVTVGACVPGSGGFQQ